MKSPFKFLLLACLVLFMISLVSCSPDLPEEVAIEYQQLPETLDFNIHVKPVLSDKCYACHGPDKAKQKAGLQLDIAVAAYAELPETPGKRAIVPGNLNKSEVYHRVVSVDRDFVTNLVW